MDELPDLPRPNMTNLSESWKGDLCHKGKSIASVSVLGGIKLPVDMPKELEVHQKVKFTEFTSKVVTEDTILTFSEITYVEQHGLMITVFKPTSESTVMNNFLTFLNKSKSVAVSVIEENNSVVFFIPSKLAPDGMFPLVPECKEPSQTDVMFGVFKLGAKYMPIKKESEVKDKDSVGRTDETADKQNSLPEERPSSEPIEPVKEHADRQESRETVQKGILKVGPNTTQQSIKDTLGPRTAALPNGLSSSKSPGDGTKQTQKKLSLGEYRTRKRLNKQKPEVVFHENPSSPPASEINKDGDIIEKNAIGSVKPNTDSSKDLNANMNEHSKRDCTETVGKKSIEDSSKRPDKNTNKVADDDNKVASKRRSKTKKGKPIDEDMPVLEKVTPLKQSSKHGPKRNSQDGTDITKTTEDVAVTNNELLSRDKSVGSLSEKDLPTQIHPENKLVRDTEDQTRTISKQKSNASNALEQRENTVAKDEPKPITQMHEISSKNQNGNIPNDDYPKETVEIMDQSITDYELIANKNSQSATETVKEIPTQMDIDSSLKEEKLEKQEKEATQTEPNIPSNVSLSNTGTVNCETEQRLFPQTITVAPLEEHENSAHELPNLEPTSVNCKDEPVFEQSHAESLSEEGGLLNSQPLLTHSEPNTNTLPQSMHDVANVQDTIGSIQSRTLQQINSQPIYSFGQSTGNIDPPATCYATTNVTPIAQQNIQMSNGTLPNNVILSNTQSGALVSSQIVSASGPLSNKVLPSNSTIVLQPTRMMPSNPPLMSVTNPIAGLHGTSTSFSHQVQTSNTSIDAFLNHVTSPNGTNSGLSNHILQPSNITTTNAQVYTNPAVDFNTSKQLIDDVFEKTDSSDTEVDISIPIRKEGIEFEPAAYYDILANIDSLRASLIQMNAAAKERAKCVEFIDQISEKLVVKRKHNVGVFKNAGTNTKRHQTTSNFSENNINLSPLNQTALYSSDAMGGAAMTTVGVNLTYSLKPTNSNSLQPTFVQSNQLNNNQIQAPQTQLCQHHQINKQTDNCQVSDMSRGESTTFVPNYRNSRDSGLGTDDSSPRSNPLLESPVRPYSGDQTLQLNLNNMQLNMIQRDKSTNGLESTQMQTNTPQLLPTNIVIDQQQNDTATFHQVSSITDGTDNFVSRREHMTSPTKPHDSFANPNDAKLKVPNHRRSRSSSSDSISSIFDPSRTEKRRSGRGKRSRSRGRHSSERRSRGRTPKSYRESRVTSNDKHRKRSISERGSWLSGRLEHKRRFGGGKNRYGRPLIGKGFPSRNGRDNSRKPKDWKESSVSRFGAAKRTRRDSSKDDDAHKRRKRESPVIPVINVKEVDPKVEAVKKRPLSIAAMLSQIRNEHQLSANSSENTSESNKEEKALENNKKEKKSRKKKDKKEKKRRTSPSSSRRKSHKHCKKVRNLSESPERRKRSRSRSSRRSDSQVTKSLTENVENIPLPPPSAKSAPRIMHSPLHIDISQEHADTLADETIKRNSRRPDDILASAVRDGVVYRTHFGSKWDSTDEYEIDNAKKDPTNNPTSSPQRAARNSLDRLQMDYANEEKSFQNTNQRPFPGDKSNDLSPRQREFDIRSSNALPQRGNLSPRAYTPPRDFERGGRLYSPPRVDWVKRERGASPPRREFSPPPRREFSPLPRREFSPPPRRDFSPTPRRDFSPPSPRREFSPPPRREFYGRARSPAAAHERETSPWRRPSPNQEFHSPPFRDSDRGPFSPPPPGGPASAANQMFKQWSDTKYISHLALVVKKMLFSPEKSLHPFINKIYACQKTIGRRLNNQSNTANDVRRRLENANNLDADEEKSLRDQVAQQGENRKKFEMYSFVFHFLKTKVDVEALLIRKTNDEQPDRIRFLTELCDGLEGKLDVLRTCRVDLLDQLKMNHQFAEETIINAAVDHCREMIDDIRKDVKNMRKEASR